ncbi:E1-E2 ATPase-domain-containing protein [Xylogone sp. PMI_703]|nr:E1-E2 ATPase-domain-containing protein [Xylogone sp. PMI_703]
MGCCSKEDPIAQKCCGDDDDTSSIDTCCKDDDKKQSTDCTEPKGTSSAIPFDTDEKDSCSTLDCCGSVKEDEDCCSESCAERLAAIECKEKCCDSKDADSVPTDSCETPCKNYCCSVKTEGSSMFLDTKNENSSRSKPTSKPCESHLRSALDRYRSQLRLASCFCRNVFEKPIDRCCKRLKSEGVKSRSLEKFNAAKSSGYSTPLRTNHANLQQTVAFRNVKTIKEGNSCSSQRVNSNDSCCTKSGTSSGESCCKKRIAYENPKTGYGKKEPGKNDCSSGCCSDEISRLSVDSCCKKDVKNIISPTESCYKGGSKNKECSEDDCCKEGTGCCGDSCCGEEHEDNESSKDCCCKEGIQKADCSDDDCCKSAPISTTKDDYPASTVDEERGLDLDHMSLSIDGMTCTGCAKKVQRTLQSISEVLNIHVSFTTGTADFDLKQDGVASMSDVVSLLERQTGFKFAKIGNNDQYIDFLTSRQSAKTIIEDPPIGVKSVEMFTKNTLRITYDASVIGARDLLSALGGLVQGLAPPPANVSLEQSKRRLYKLLIATILSAVCTIPVVVLAWASTPVSKKTSAIISISLATIVQAIAIPEFYKPALTSLFHYGMIEMDMLVVMSISAAYGYSVIAFGFLFGGKPLETESFFETSTLLITLVLLGRLVTSFARVRAIAAVSLHSFQARKALLLDENNNTSEIDPRLLQQGDTFMVMPHSQIPTDGKVIDGTSEVDESLLTGENLPITKKPGSIVLAGTMNGEGILRVLLTRLPGNNTISEIGNLVDQAAKTKPRSQDLADKLSRYFIPLILGVSIVVFSIWVAVCLRVRDKDTGDSIVTAITYAIAVLAISCPCALGLAVPMVYVVAGGVSARQGIIVKSSETLESASRVTDVLFDKTGTITTGELEVVAEHILDQDTNTIVGIILTMVGATQHPVSQAILKHIKSSVILAPTPLQEARSIPGCGILARLGSSEIKAGNAYWLSLSDHPIVKRLHDDHQTVFCVVKDLLPIAIFGLKAHIRPEAATVIEKLQQRGIEVHLVSGDAAAAVHNTGEALNIPLSNIMAQCSPATKRSYIQSLITNQSSGRTVLFLGDGTNDASAISQSHVGVQLGSLSDLAGATADVVILSNNLGSIITLLDLSAAAHRRIMFNFIWAGLYNLFAILFAAGAFVKFRIPPAWAGLGELVSVLPVVVVGVSMVWTV